MGTGQRRPAPMPFAPGVSRRDDSSGGDFYQGTGAALVEAGLIAAEHLPGQPGMNKTCVTVRADGMVPKIGGNMQPGDRWIQRLRSGKFEVFVCVALDEHERRWSALLSAPEAPDTRETEAQHRRAAMRLVWSRSMP